MSAEQRKGARRDWLLAATLVAAGLLMGGLSLFELRARSPQELAQATPTPQGSPSNEPAQPAESKPGGTRPTTPAPEPARPDPEAQKAGAKPVLPPAPAEKIAPPIKENSGICSVDMTIRRRLAANTVSLVGLILRIMRDHRGPSTRSS